MRVVPWVLLFCLSVIGFSNARADDAHCNTEKLTAVIDGSGDHQSEADPFSFSTWRTLNKLGNPVSRFDASGYGDNYQQQQAWVSLVKQLAPVGTTLTNPPYGCSIGYTLATLHERLTKLGRNSPYVAQWLKAENQVLQSCDYDSKGKILTLPPPLDASGDLALLQAADRAYQQASITFYQDPGAAVAAFRAIAASDSPHRAAARYMVARSYADSKNFDASRTEIDEILADPSLQSVFQITRELKGFVQNSQDTPESWSKQLDDVVAEVTKPSNQITTDEDKNALANAESDLEHVGVRQANDDWWIESRLPKNPTLSKALAGAARKHPLIMWTMAGESVLAKQQEFPWNLMGAKWRAWQQSYVTRAEALQPHSLDPLAKDMLESLIATPDKASRSALWAKVRAASDQAKASCGAAPETATLGLLAQQATRVSALAGDFKQIFTGLDATPLPGTKTLDTFVLAPLTKFLLATNQLGEGRAVRNHYPTFGTNPDTRRLVAWLAEDENHALAAIKDKDNGDKDQNIASPLLNLQSIKTFRKLSSDTSLTSDDRAIFERTAWTRNLALRGMPQPATWPLNQPLADSYNAVGQEYPEISPTHQLLLTVLRNPRLNILVNSPDEFSSGQDASDKFDAINEYDHNDKNWWCPLEPDRLIGAIRTDYQSAIGVGGLSSPNYKSDVITNDQAKVALAKSEYALRAHPLVKAMDWAEVQRLASAQSAPQFLATKALEWAKASDGKDGAPEALALAVRVTHYGCNWHGGVGAYSKPAKELLKGKWPDSDWAKQTPYWFDCGHRGTTKTGEATTTCSPQLWPKQQALH